MNEESSNPSPTVSPEEIALRAYTIYVEEGCPEGRSEEHWAQAEAELNGKSPRPSVADVMLKSFGSTPAESSSS